MALFVTVVYDANILYPAALRDLFMRLAQAGLVRARWRHVLAAAIQAGASIIVTSNLKDFPRSELARHGIRPLHPDELLLSLLELHLAEVCAVVKKWRQSLHSPSRTARDLLATLQRQGLARSVQRLEQHIALL